MTRILFLDIDGVMIPATQQLLDPNSSWKRNFPQTTIAVINEICKRTEARIVFNTTHNNPIPNAPDIEVTLVNQGLNEDYLFNQDLKTKL